MFQQVLGPKHPEVAANLNNLGYVYSMRGDHDKAVKYYGEALEIYQAVHGEKHATVAKVLSNLSMQYGEQNALAQAVDLQHRAMKIYQQLYGKHHPEIAVSYHNLAGLYVDQNDFPKALAAAGSALDALTRQRPGKKAPAGVGEADGLEALPITLLALELRSRILESMLPAQPPAAALRACARSYEAVADLLERLRTDSLETLDSKLLHGEGAFDWLPRLLRIYQKLHDLEGKNTDLHAAFDAAERATARVFTEALTRSRARRLVGLPGKVAAQETNLRMHLRFLDNRLAVELDKSLAQRDQALVEKLLQEREDVEKTYLEFVGQLGKTYPQYAAFKSQQVCTLAQARACLEPDEVALLVVPGNQMSCLVLVEARPQPGDRDDGLAVYELPGWHVLAEQVATLSDPRTLEKPARVKALAREVFDAVLGPCENRLKDKHLVIVPDGPLCFLPFGMLVGPDGKFLLQKHRIRYAPSLSVLHHIRVWNKDRPRSQVPLFAVGDPVYEANDRPAAKYRGQLGRHRELLAVRLVPAQRGDRPPGGVAPPPGGPARRDLLWREGKPATFPRLVHSGQEVAAIAKLLQASPEYVLTGEQASVANVKAASANGLLGRARYVHFATHGILGLDQGKQPALILSLVGNKEEDGFLQMDEIAGLKLNADLVVLSACRTGQGYMHHGEGVTGLARAFLYAGSKGVVCSLWSVADQETADLMVDCYARLQRGGSATEALREAQLSLIRANKAPIYWAPFILIGE
jgi:CHAT domain-containing protein/tetratricopeptide (TPR) repeat protein